MTKTKECFVPGCARDSLPSSKFCSEHVRAAEAWLTEENRLDTIEESRQLRPRDWLDDRPSWADYLRAIGWEDPSQAAGWTPDEDEEAA